MRHASRQLLLRLLLLVVFFNTAVGVPLHAAEHLHGHEAAVAQACAPAAEAVCTDDEHGTSHAQCVWCSSHAQLGMALGAADVVLPPALAPPTAWLDAARDAFIPLPQRWRFAARDPPPLS